MSVHREPVAPLFAKSGALDVDMIHLYPMENAQMHNTDKYELVHLEDPIPVLRRGQIFTAALRFGTKRFNETHDIVRLVFSFGPEPSVTNGTKAIIRLTKEFVPENKRLWQAKILTETDESLQLEIRAPADIPVGNWVFAIETSTKADPRRVKVFEFDRDVFFLFNPYCKEDLVYMPDKRLLDEYILMDVGKIWVGPFNSARGREWIFGQFDATVLPAAMLMLDKSGMPFSSRGDPIKLSRVISKMVNSNDEDGVLVGNWDGIYADGTAPAAWGGSIEILEKYLSSMGESVKYGQCWVFSGVVTTIARALGIPSRVVSNLVSAHDANSTLSVDKYFTANDEELETDPKNPDGYDSIWNYHVWNDVWMARPDLPRGYGGWQAIDATPQEASQGFFQCGPASLEAIKQGTVGLNYDVPFMISSVNADLMRWKEDRTTDFGYTKIWTNKYHIGRMILTKAPWVYDPNGDKDRDDITHLYKAKEGSETERMSLFNAVRSSDIAKRFYAMAETGTEDMDFTLEDVDRVPIGEKFTVAVIVKNKSSKVKRIKASLSVRSVFYNGVRAQEVKKTTGEFTIEPRSRQRLKMIVEADDYLDKLVEYCQMKVHAIATVIDTKETWADEDDFEVMTPNIDIKLSKDIVAKRQTTVKLSFKNPLHKRLTNCQFRLAGPGLLKNVVLPYANVEPLAMVELSHKFIPLTTGQKKIVATFVSRELVDITGSKKLEVFDEDDFLTFN